MSSERTMSDNTVFVQCIGENGPMTPEDCAKWLDAKYARHGELEDKRVDAARYLWLNADGDRCAQVVADAYSDWDTDVHWEEHFDAAVTEAMRRASSNDRCVNCGVKRSLHSAGGVGSCGVWAGPS
jgi:hypothetical protein